MLLTQKCPELWGLSAKPKDWEVELWRKKSGTGDPLHTQEPVTVASFRTWRGWRECIARDRCLTGFDSNIGLQSSVVSLQSSAGSCNTDTLGF